MTTFAGSWIKAPNAQQAAGQLPWGNIMVRLDKVPDQEFRVWYAASAVEYGRSRNVLLNMIMNKSLEHTRSAPSNFAQQLAAQSWSC